MVVLVVAVVGRCCGWVVDDMIRSFSGIRRMMFFFHCLFRFRTSFHRASLADFSSLGISSFELPIAWSRRFESRHDWVLVEEDRLAEVRLVPPQNFPLIFRLPKRERQAKKPPSSTIVLPLLSLQSQRNKKQKDNYIKYIYLKIVNTSNYYNYNNCTVVNIERRVWCLAHKWMPKFSSGGTEG